MRIFPESCKVFGKAASVEKLKNWINIWGDDIINIDFFLIIAGSLTAEVEGISAAGSTPESRRYTAIADTELLIYGPKMSRKYPLPPLPAGVSPALISFVAASWLRIKPKVISVGLAQKPSFPYLCLESPRLGPSSCLSTGKAMSEERVENLWNSGFLIGRKSQKPLLIAECVPGGTTTAQAVFTGLGLPVDDLISSSARHSPVELKKNLIDIGLLNADLSETYHPRKLIAALGDPFQAVAVGLLLGARDAGQPILLAGGCQMLAVLALALEVVEPGSRSDFVDKISIATTSWLLEELTMKKNKQSNLKILINLVGDHYDVDLFGVASGLRFEDSYQRALKDYEKGFVKEGVGAGALSLLALLHGATEKELISGCEKALNDLERNKIL